MKTFILMIFLLLGSATTFTQPMPMNDYHGPITTGFWLYPFMTQAQADQMIGYDILILHNELFYKESPMIDYIIGKNPKIKLFVYFNPVEFFVPPYEDCPWAIKMVKELNNGEKKAWWLLQPNGKPATFWTGADGRKTNLMDMRITSAMINGEVYPEYIANKFNQDILRDKRIVGVEVDNAWPDIYWLGLFIVGNKGLDFDRNKIADKNPEAINQDWKAGENRFIKLIRQYKGENFIIIANPGSNLAYNVDLNGKIFENWPIKNAGDNTNGGWNIGMYNASKTGPYSVLNADKGNWFFTLCSAMLLDKACFADVQNAPYRTAYKINLGKPLEPQPSNFKKNLPIYSRKFEKGTVYVSPKQGKAWIHDTNDQPLYNQEGQCVQ